MDYLRSIQKVLLLFVLFALSFCSSRESKQKARSCRSNIKNLTQLLNQRIDEIPKIFNNCYDLQDTIFESDEGVEWLGKQFIQNGEICFIAETNWQNPKLISQIELLSSSIEIRKGVKVGKEFKEIASSILADIPSMPDGYLAVKDKENSHVWYFLDIEKHPELFYGVESVQQIPKELLIEYILIK